MLLGSDMPSWSRVKRPVSCIPRWPDRCRPRPVDWALGTGMGIAGLNLRPGDRIQITSGDTVPADGRIESGHVMVDEALLSGESIPRRRREGESVLAGSLVREGQMVLVIEQRGPGNHLVGHRWPA